MKYHRVIWLRSGMKSDENNSISWIQADYADVWLQKWNRNILFLHLAVVTVAVVVAVCVLRLSKRVGSSDVDDSYFPCSSKLKFFMFLPPFDGMTIVMVDSVCCMIHVFCGNSNSNGKVSWPDKWFSKKRSKQQWRRSRMNERTNETRTLA